MHPFKFLVLVLSVYALLYILCDSTALVNGHPCPQSNGGHLIYHLTH